MKLNTKIYFLISFLILLLGTDFQLSQHAAAAVKNREYKLQSFLSSREINGIILYGTNTNKPEVVSNNNFISNTGEMVKPNKYFPIASLQKVITAVAIYDLVKDGDLSWNTTINRFCPNVKYGNCITIWDLMTHKSGIYDNASVPKKVLLSEAERKDFMYKHMMVKKNHNWRYSSSNYGILADIIEKVSGSNYYSYIAWKVTKGNIRPFNKVSLYDTILPICPNSRRQQLLYLLLGSNYLADFHKSPNSIVERFSIANLNESCSGAYGAGDLLATPIDYWKFINNLISDKETIELFSKESRMTEKNYFGDLYFKKDYIHASGSIGTYNCCCLASNYKTGKTIMLFSNNIKYKKLKGIQQELYQMYFGKEIFE